MAPAFKITERCYLPMKFVKLCKACCIQDKEKKKKMCIVTNKGSEKTSQRRKNGKLDAV